MFTIPLIFMKSGWCYYCKMTLILFIILEYSTIYFMYSWHGIRSGEWEGYWMSIPREIFYSDGVSLKCARCTILSAHRHISFTERLFRSLTKGNFIIFLVDSKWIMNVVFNEIKTNHSMTKLRHTKQ